MVMRIVMLDFKAERITMTSLPPHSLCPREEIPVSVTFAPSFEHILMFLMLTPFFFNNIVSFI